MSRHRAEVRPRWGRLAATAGAATVVVAAIVGAVELPGHHGGSAQAYDPAAASAPSTSPAAPRTPAHSTSPAAPSSSAPASSGSDASSSAATGRTSAASTPAVPRDPTALTGAGAATDTALPARSGSGRRAVYDISDQRVWIVDADDHVQRTYLVSGSVEDNLKTGTYHVYGRSEQAEGVDDSGYMRYFVRFAYGTDQGASIGFHEIPTTEPDDQGRPLQTLQQLGTPESHGCIRQKTADAVAMWDFAQVGTEVVVLA